MFRVAMAAVLFAGVAFAQKPAPQKQPTPAELKRIAELEKMIAENEKKIEAMKNELRKLRPSPQVTGLPFGQLTVGDVGTISSPFGLLPKLFKIIDDETMLVMMTYHPEKPVVMMKYPTKGLAEDRFFNEEKDFPGKWKVTKTQKYGNTTYYFIEPN